MDPGAPPAEIDARVRALAARGESLYVLDAEQLLRLAPDLIVTQDLCHVCAASPDDLAAVLARLPAERRPRVLSFTPHSLDDVWRGIRDIACAAGRCAAGEALAARLAGEVSEVASRVPAAGRPRVVCLEWFDPPYVAGHWVPEMVRLAGGQDALGREGEPSFAVGWRAVVEAAPEVILLMSCGYDVQRNLEVWNEVCGSSGLPPGWRDVPAVRSGRVFAVDANACFSRPGPRLADGVTLLASLLHPAVFGAHTPGLCSLVRSVCPSTFSV